jgi:4-amino-4-deoxy-L-arabinose transferase-like glycosyltransferase
MSAPPSPARKTATLRRLALLDALFVGLMCSVVIVGIPLAPFHGDEATIIAMSRDFAALTSGRSADLRYSDPPTGDPASQELRLLNGNLTFFGIGLLWTLAGFVEGDLNQQWDWGADYAYNVSTGHLPIPDLMLVGRVWNVLCTCLSIAAVFAIARCLVPIARGDTGSRLVAWSATIIYTLLPTVLLNGRRANFEGAALLTMTVTLLAVVILVQRRRTMGSARPFHWLLFGLAAGGSIAAKHNNLLVVAPLFAGVLMLLLTTHRTALLGWLGASGVMLLTFFALNPAWWGLDLRVPEAVLRLRVDLIRNQTAAYAAEALSDPAQRVGIALTAPIAPPQYFEVERGWAEWLAQPIARYESERIGVVPMAGISLPVVSLLVPAIGLVAALRGRAGRAERWLVVLSGGSVLAFLVLLNPLPWQRYYLPLAPFVALAYGAGVGALWTAVRGWRRNKRGATHVGSA